MTHWIHLVEVASEGLVAQLTLNGVDVFTEWAGSQRRLQTKLNPFIVEGSNHLELALTRMTDDEGAPLDGPASFTVTLVRGEHGRDPGPEGVFARFTWDEAAMPVEPGTLTGVWARQFTVPADRAYGRWSWQDAPATPPNEQDAQELVALVHALHTALSNRDADAVAAIATLKHAELARALDIPVDEIAEGERDLLGGLFADPSWRVAPFDPAQLAAAPCAGGRLVRVTDAQGGPPLVAGTLERPYFMGFLATRLQGRWTLVR